LHNGTFCPISASGSNFNPRNIQYIPVVEIFAFLELEQKLPFFKGLVALRHRLSAILLFHCLNNTTNFKENPSVCQILSYKYFLIN